MVQFRILSGKQAGATWVARRFPVRIGRAGNADFQLEEDGVWDQHLLLECIPESGFLLTRQGDALAAVNGDPIDQALLRNGDTIELGSARLQFWLAETRQTGLGLREALTWAAVATVIAAQGALLYLLLR